MLCSQRIQRKAESVWVGQARLFIVLKLNIHFFQGSSFRWIRTSLTFLKCVHYFGLLNSGPHFTISHSITSHRFVNSKSQGIVCYFGCEYPYFRLMFLRDGFVVFAHTSISEVLELRDQLIYSIYLSLRLNLHNYLLIRAENIKY